MYEERVKLGKISPHEPELGWEQWRGYSIGCALRMRCSTERLTSTSFRMRTDKRGPQRNMTTYPGELHGEVVKWWSGGVAKWDFVVLRGSITRALKE
jgi:hypothetical protein